MYSIDKNDICYNFKLPVGTYKYSFCPSLEVLELACLARLAYAPPFVSSQLLVL